MTYKSGMYAKVVDSASLYLGCSGLVIATSTRDDFQLVGLRLPGYDTVWFISSQLTPKK